MPMLKLQSKSKYADVTELADVQASDTCGYYFLVGSSPIVRTKNEEITKEISSFFFVYES